MRMWNYVMFMVLMSTVAYGGAADLEQQKAAAVQELQDLAQQMG